MAVAAMPDSRVTHDCDVIESEPDSIWAAVQSAAQAVASERGLPKDWLNRESRMYAHLLPVGWRQRCESIGQIGPLNVLAIGRIDLMAMKLMGARERPQDLEDIIAKKATESDVAFLRDHLVRLEAESLDRETHDAERVILDELVGES